MNFDVILFYVLSVILVVAAFRVITATQPVTGVLNLILTFFTASMMWMLIQAEFLSLILMIVYVGAVLVLFLFVVMMLDVRSDGLKKGLKVYLPLGLTIGGIMILEMAFVVLRSWGDSPELVIPGGDYDNTRVLGEAMYTEFAYAVQIGGLILLVGMIAAIALTMRKRSDYKRVHPSDQVYVRPQGRMRLVNIPSQTEAKPEPAPESTDEGAKQ